MIRNRCRITFQLLSGVMLLGVGTSKIAGAQVDLYVGTHNFGEPTFHYDGTTGAFINSFGSFPNERGLGIAVGSNGDVYASYFDSGLIRRFNGQTGALLDTFNPNEGTLSGLRFGPDGLLYGLSAQHLFRYNASTDSGLFTFPYSGINNNYQRLAFGPDGNVNVSAATFSNATAGIQKYNPTTGAYLGTFIPAGTGGLGDLPEGLAFGPDGSLYVVDAVNEDILRFNGTTGAFLNVFVPAGSGGLIVPNDITFGPDGNFYVTDLGGHDILRYNGTTGAFLNDFVTPGSGGLIRPESLVFSGSPNAAVPEPGPFALLMGSSITCGLLLLRRRRQ